MVNVQRSRIWVSDFQVKKFYLVSGSKLTPLPGNNVPKLRRDGMSFSGGPMARLLPTQEAWVDPGQGARYHKPQLKILYSTTKTNKYIIFLL